MGPCFVEATIAADDQVALVIRIDVQRMVVNVLVAFAEPREAAATVFRNLHVRVERIDAIELVRAGEDFLVVLRAAGNVAAAFAP